MAAWFYGLLVLLIPLAFAEVELPCDGYEVAEGFGLGNLDEPHQFGVKVLEAAEDVDEPSCWSRCCDNKACDLASVSAGKCYLIRCKVVGFDMCDLTQVEGGRTYKKQDIGPQPTQDDFCLPEKKTGDCRAFFPRLAYNANTGTCENFTYGGCPVNLNNHMGESECMQKCQGVKAVKVRDPEAPSKRMASATSLPDYCSGPYVTGNCRAAFPRWYFDAESMSCRQFTYGGCGGSENNHLSEQECSAKCVGPKPEPEKVHAPKKGDFAEYCAAPSFTGPCRAAFRRWFYDSTSGSCRTFVYGGCKPKSNNYLTEAACMDMCSGRTEDGELADPSVVHRSATAVVLPILLAFLAATLIGIMVLFFVKVARKNQETAGFRAMWNPIDDKECLMNSAYTL